MGSESVCPASAHSRMESPDFSRSDLSIPVEQAACRTAQRAATHSHYATATLSYKRTPTLFILLKINRGNRKQVRSLKRPNSAIGPQHGFIRSEFVAESSEQKAKSQTSVPDLRTESRNAGMTATASFEPDSPLTCQRRPMKSRSRSSPSRMSAVERA